MRADTSSWERKTIRCVRLEVCARSRGEGVQGLRPKSTMDLHIGRGVLWFCWGADDVGVGRGDSYEDIGDLMPERPSVGGVVMLGKGSHRIDSHHKARKRMALCRTGPMAGTRRLG